MGSALGAVAIPIAGGDTHAAPVFVEQRMRLITDALRQAKATRVLDAGCGSGGYVKLLTESGFEVMGVEYQAEKLDPCGGVVARASIEALPFSTGSFDAVLINEVLEHVPDDRQGLREIRRVLKQDGMLICFSPNRLFPFETHGVIRNGSEPVGEWAPGIPYVPMAIGRRFWTYWARNYWPWELRGLIQQEGFRITGTTVLWLTFEGITGRAHFGALRGILRTIAQTCQRVPFIRWFGTSQMILATKEMPLERPIWAGVAAVSNHREWL